MSRSTWSRALGRGTYGGCVVEEDGYGLLRTLHRHVRRLLARATAPNPDGRFEHAHSTATRCPQHDGRVPWSVPAALRVGALRVRCVRELLQLWSTRRWSQQCNSAVQVGVTAVQRRASPYKPYPPICLAGVLSKPQPPERRKPKKHVSVRHPLAGASQSAEHLIRSGERTRLQHLESAATHTSFSCCTQRASLCRRAVRPRRLPSPGMGKKRLEGWDCTQHDGAYAWGAESTLRRC
jgi:hypothetical protein